MSVYKVLSLPISLSVTDEEDFLFLSRGIIDSKKKMEPVFGRLGMYLDRKKNICWVETLFGCWVMGNRDAFQSELEYQTSDEHILPSITIESFKILDKYGILTKELLSMWHKHTHAIMLRNTRRSVLKMWLED